MSAPARDGGKPEVKPMPYCPPVGPKQSGTPNNSGNSGSQHK